MGDILHRLDEIWRGGGDRRSPTSHQISPHRCNSKGIGPQKLKFLLRFDQNVEYKRPAGAYLYSAIYTKFADFEPVQAVLAVKISLDLLKGLWRF